MTVDFFREHFTSKPRNPLRSAATEDKFAWPPLHSWGENVGPYYFPSVVEKKDDRLLRPSFSRPFGKESKPPLFILEKRDRDQRQRRKYPSSKHKQKNVLLLSSLEPPCDDVRPPKGFTSPGLAVKATPSSSVTAKKVDDLWPMKSPAIRSPAKETDPPSVFALEKETPGEQRKARTSPKCEKKTDPVSSALENRHDQWLKRPTSPVWTTAAIPSSTDSEKPDDDIWCGKPVWYSRGSKASPNSVFTEKENICQARSEITTVIPPGIIETAIKQLKIVEAQVKKTSLFTDAALAEAVVAGAISVDETGVDTAVEDTTEVNDIFYMPLEQPLLPTESEIEGLPDLELEDFGYWYPKRASHAYRDYGEDGWVEVLPWKEWKDPENYPCEI
jgi:hypothetical protein